MEENHPFNSDQIENLPELVIDPRTRNFLFETAKWGRFLAIFGFVGFGIFLLLAVAIIVFSSFFDLERFEDMPKEMGLSMGLGMGFGYLLGAALYYFPISYLYQFSKKIKQALEENNQQVLSYAFSKLKSFFKYFGYLAIIMICLYGFAFFIGLLGGLASLI